MKPSSDSSFDSLQQHLEAMSNRKQDWKNLPAQKKTALLKRMLRTMQDIDHRTWADHSIHRQGFDKASQIGRNLSGIEQLINVSTIVGTLRALIRTYTALDNSNSPPTLSQRRTRPDGRNVLHTFPTTLQDKFNPLSMAGCTGEVWILPDKPVRQDFSPMGNVALVLGAGNQNFLAFGDVMHELFVKGNVCILKHHPVRQFSDPFFEQLFAPLIEEHFFLSVSGDIALSQWLCHHDLIDSVHMTGGTATHDAIVWGAPAEQTENKANNTPVLTKPMTSELGCITPWIVCSGATWTAKELTHHARYLATCFTGQNSCNCLAPKLLVLDENWPQKEDFLTELRRCLNNMDTLPPYYPGTTARYAAFQEAYSEPEVEFVHSSRSSEREHGFGEQLPWMLLHLDQDSDPYALQNEAFAPVLAICSLPAENSSSAFLTQAVSFVNEKVWGTLSCTLLVHDSIQRRSGEMIEEAIQNLKYGTIGVNNWTAMAYTIDGGVWGAYPGEELHNVASGIGFVRNAFMIQDVEKAVLRGPFRNVTQIALAESGSFPVSPSQCGSIADVLITASLRNIGAVVRSFLLPSQPLRQT